MGFWIIITLLAVLVLALLTLALLRGRPGLEPSAAYDMRIYRDQLKEVDRDLARGVIAPGDAERVRTEVSRRILTADSEMSQGATGPGQTGAPTWAALVILTLCLLGGSLWLYRDLGAPGYGDLAQSTRIALAEEARRVRPPQAEAEASLPPSPQTEPLGEDYIALVERLRETVAERPDDLQGQTLLARNEAILGNYAAAYRAQGEVVRLKGSDATSGDWADYADMMILAAGGYVSPEAEVALKQALERDPRDGPARYYWGLMLAQTGRPDLAFNTWRRLLRESRPNAPWVPPIRAQIEQIAERAGTDYTLPPLAAQAPPTPQPDEAPLAGPSAEDVEAAGEMSAEDRAEMIRNMVDGLSERLATEGGTPAEWARLIGALGVLGDTDRARAIWQEAQQVFAQTPDALATVTAAAQRVGLTE